MHARVQQLESDAALFREAMVPEAEPSSRGSFTHFLPGLLLWVVLGESASSSTDPHCLLRHVVGLVRTMGFLCKDHEPQRLQDGRLNYDKKTFTLNRHTLSAS